MIKIRQIAFNVGLVLMVVGVIALVISTFLIVCNALPFWVGYVCAIITFTGFVISVFTISEPD